MTTNKKTTTKKTTTKKSTTKKTIRKSTKTPAKKAPRRLTAGLTSRERLESIKSDLLKDLMKVKDLDSLKKEFQKIKTQLSKIDFKKEFTAETSRRLKQAEKSYAKMGSEISKIQKQVDREIEKTMSFLKKAKFEAKKSVKKVAQTAEAERKRITKELKKNKSKRPPPKK